MHKKVVSVGSRVQDKDELFKVFKGFPTNGVRLIPTWFLKKISKMISPFVKCVVNQSFSEGIVPKSSKSAQITPLLKRLVLITTLLHPTDPSLFCLFCPSSQRGLFSTES